MPVKTGYVSFLKDLISPFTSLGQIHCLKVAVAFHVLRLSCKGCPQLAPRASEVKAPVESHINDGRQCPSRGVVSNDLKYVWTYT